MSFAQAIEGTLYREPGAPQNTPPLILFFQEKAVKDERASRDGPPVFDTVIQVRVVVAGSKGNEGPIYEIQRTKPDGTVKLDGAAYNRFGKPFEEWKQGKSPALAGTPLEQWPLMDVAMVATLKAAHVYTVQQLAGLSDAQLDQCFRRDGRQWRAKAESWLDEAKTAAGDAEARARIAKLEQDNEELQVQVRQLLTKQNTPGFEQSRRGRRERTQAQEEADVSVAISEEPDRRL